MKERFITVDKVVYLRNMLIALFAVIILGAISLWLIHELNVRNEIIDYFVRQDFTILQNEQKQKYYLVRGG